jgi:hypothetical protein
MRNRSSLVVATMLALNAEHLYLLGDKKIKPGPTEEKIKKSVLEGNRKILKAQKKRDKKAAQLLKINKRLT